MWNQWRRWNWGLQQSPSRKSRLSLDRKLLPTASTWLDWLMHVSWRWAACVANNTGHKLLLVFCCSAVFRAFLIGSFHTEDGTSQLGRETIKTKTEEQNSRQAGEVESYFRCVIRHCGQWEQCVFSVVDCGQSVWLPVEQQAAALDLQIPVDLTVRVRRPAVCVCVWRCFCIYGFSELYFCLFCSKGFASPRLELLHNIDPLYVPMTPCKFTFHMSQSHVKME